jgi:hypothetical protein
MISPGVYQHYAGGNYRVLFIAKDSNNGPNEDQNVVVYVSLHPGGKHQGTSPGRISVRNEKEFEELINPTSENPEGVRRFTRIGD